MIPLLLELEATFRLIEGRSGLQSRIIFQFFSCITLFGGLVDRITNIHFLMGGGVEKFQPFGGGSRLGFKAKWSKFRQ